MESTEGCGTAETRKEIKHKQAGTSLKAMCQLFRFIWSASFSLALSAWRSVCAQPCFGSGYVQISQRKPIIRTHLRLEKGSDYMDVVRVWGFEPQRVAAREPKGNVTSVKVFVVQKSVSCRRPQRSVLPAIYDRV